MVDPSGDHVGNLRRRLAAEAYIVPDNQLREHRERSARLVNIARDSVEELFRQIVGQNYVLLLTDEQGVTVDYFGDDTFKHEFFNVLGCTWGRNGLKLVRGLVVWVLASPQGKP